MHIMIVIGKNGVILARLHLAYKTQIRCRCMYRGRAIWAESQVDKYRLDGHSVGSLEACINVQRGGRLGSVTEDQDQLQRAFSGA